MIGLSPNSPPLFSAPPRRPAPLDLQTIAVAHTLSTPHPMIHSSHDTTLSSLLSSNISYNACIWPRFLSLPLNAFSVLLTSIRPPALSPSSCTPVPSQSHPALSSAAMSRRPAPNYPVLHLHCPFGPQKRPFTPPEPPPIIIFTSPLTSQQPSYPSRYDGLDTADLPRRSPTP